MAERAGGGAGCIAASLAIRSGDIGAAFAMSGVRSGGIGCADAAPDSMANASAAGMIVKDFIEGSIIAPPWRKGAVASAPVIQAELAHSV